jgi:hypothetical protein
MLAHISLSGNSSQQQTLPQRGFDYTRENTREQLSAEREREFDYRQSAKHAVTANEKPTL